MYECIFFYYTSKQKQYLLPTSTSTFACIYFQGRVCCFCCLFLLTYNNNRQAICCSLLMDINLHIYISIYMDLSAFFVIYCFSSARWQCVNALIIRVITNVHMY